MTTPAQGKGKKKNKEVMKVSLDEFNQIDAPRGHSVVSLKMTGIDWAATMADYDQQATETQQIIVPAAPRAQRGPAVDFDSLPTEPPFRVSLYNLPMSVEEKELTERFLVGIDVKRVDIQKTSTTVELGSRQDLYDALTKDGTSIKGKTVNVCLFGEAPQNNYGQDRYGGRGSNSSYGDRSYQSGGYGAQRSGDRYGGGGFNRDRDNYTGYNRGGSGGGFNQQRGGYGDRFNDNRNNYRDTNRGQYTSGGGEPPSEEPENWRARPTVKPPTPTAPTSYNNGSRQPYMHSRPESSQHPQYHQSTQSHHHQQYQQPDSNYQSRYQPHHHHHDQPSNSPYSQLDHQANSNNKQIPATTVEERPKLIIHKRKTPLNIDDVSSVARNEAIFGKAKPSSTPYEKMNEIEKKLSAVQIVDKNEPKTASQAGSQSGSAPRSRRVSSNHSESKE